MQVSTLLQTDNHTNTSPLSFLQAGCPSCCPTNSVKALKAVKLKLRRSMLVAVRWRIYSCQVACSEMHQKSNWVAVITKWQRRQPVVLHVEFGQVASLREDSVRDLVDHILLHVDWLTQQNNATTLNGAALTSLSPQQTTSDHFLNVQHSNVTSTKPFFQYLLQAESNSSCPIGDLWRHAVSCGHYGAKVWQPLPAMQLWRWRTARSGKREPMLTTSRSDFLCRLHAMPGIQPTVSNHWKHCHNWSKSLLICQITSASFIMNYLPALRSSQTMNRHSVDIYEGRTKRRPRIYL